jgi:hypothetical protein
MTVLDLLRHTSGGCIRRDYADALVKYAYAMAGVYRKACGTTTPAL